MLEVHKLTKNFGALRATDGIDFDVRDGETHAVIGPNGAGKTTFISQLAGDLRPDGGRIVFGGEDVTALAAPAARGSGTRQPRRCHGGQHVARRAPAARGGDGARARAAALAAGRADG